MSPFVYEIYCNVFVEPFFYLYSFRIIFLGVFLFCTSSFKINKIITILFDNYIYVFFLEIPMVPFIGIPRGSLTLTPCASGRRVQAVRPDRPPRTLAAPCPHGSNGRDA